MATKALLYSPDKLTFEKRKVTACEALVRQLKAIKLPELGKRVYQRLNVNSVLLPGNLKQSCTPKTIRYIPDKLPSHKAPGTKAIGPVVEQGSATRARIIVANMIAAGR